MHDRKAIVAKLEALKGKLEKEIKDLEEKGPDFGSDTDHFEEEAEETTAHGTNFGIAHALRERLADVETALEKLAAGTYGKCEKCGMAIEAEILKTDPESRSCRACKLAMKKK